MNNVKSVISRHNVISRHDVLDTFETYLQSLEMEEKESIILGDFNCNVLEINKTPHTSKLTSPYDEYQYTQLIKLMVLITYPIGF